MDATNKPTHVTLSVATAERVLTALAQQPLGAVFDVFVQLKQEVEASIRAQQEQKSEGAE